MSGAPADAAGPPAGGGARLPLRMIALQWTRIGVTGFGGPPTHIALLRRLVVERRWIDARELEDAIAACNLLPGPASTQLAIFCARRLAGPAGAVVGGLCFVTPAVAIMIALSALFLGHAAPEWVRGAGAGAGAAVPAVAVQAGVGLYAHPRSRARGSSARAERRVAGRARRLAYRGRWLVYAALGAGAAAALGPYLVLVLLGCGIAELLVNGTDGTLQQGSASVGLPVPLLSVVRVGAAAGLGAVVWVAFKVGALSYGGGFVIVPLMRTDAVHTYHWMSSNQFLTAVALGQVTPGPVVATVASVGYAARGVAGGVLAAVVAFAPSFLFVLAGGGHFERLRESALAQSFLDGAGPAAIGAILGAAIPLAAALSEAWQILVLAAAALSLLVARRGIVATLLAAGFVGAVVALAGGSLPR